MSLWIKLGVLAAAGLACLALLAVEIGQLGGAAGAFTDTYQVVAHFDDATGVTPNDEVRLAGVRIGKVSGVSVGKGFQGGIKRHNFSRGPVSHGSHNVRAPGSIGASTFPARVFKGMRMPGQMGNKRITQKGLEVAQVDADRNLLLIKGSVPGSRNSMVEVRTDG